MKPPCEYVIKSYLPQLRARIVREFIESHSWSITSAAKAIGISSTAAEVQEDNSDIKRLLQQKFRFVLEKLC
ncbi:MAG: hypothetical protein FGF51_03250 [Candidatus Brockarchaeota archaeon]|nr:hypothetical protein [Candidatus Brockarchaeota archaeon]